VLGLRFHGWAPLFVEVIIDGCGADVRIYEEISSDIYRILASANREVALGSLLGEFTSDAHASLLDRLLELWESRPLWVGQERLDGFLIHRWVKRRGKHSRTPCVLKIIAIMLLALAKCGSHKRWSRNDKNEYTRLASLVFRRSVSQL